MKPVIIKAKMAVEIIYENLNNLPHPDHGALRMMYFGHQSDGQRKITRGTAEAIVMLLEANGLIICNGLSEAAHMLAANGYRVEPPEVDSQVALEAAQDSVDTVPLFDLDDEGNAKHE